VECIFPTSSPLAVEDVGGGKDQSGKRGRKGNLQDVIVTHTSSLEMCTG
jgi:hypothetical protein